MLILTGTELNVSSAMGFILLIGLVVKNGIVMIDYAHHLQAGGKPFAEAVAEAARVRLRSGSFFRGPDGAGHRRPRVANRRFWG